MSEQFTSAWVYEHLTPALDAATAKMHASRLQLNSAALWWFLSRLTAEERSEVLGEYVRQLALRGQSATGGRADGKGKASRWRKG
jgi:hypothetical protein